MADATTVQRREPLASYISPVAPLHACQHSVMSQEIWTMYVSGVSTHKLCNRALLLAPPWSRDAKFARVCIEAVRLPIGVFDTTEGQMPGVSLERELETAVHSPCDSGEKV